MDDASAAPFPHCDSLVLHKPGVCIYCDHYTVAQNIRIRDGINFTGENDPTKKPCPSTQRRSLADIEAWGGNRAKKDDTEPFDFDAYNGYKPRKK